MTDNRDEGLVRRVTVCRETMLDLANLFGIDLCNIKGRNADEEWHMLAHVLRVRAHSIVNYLNERYVNDSKNG